MHAMFGSMMPAQRKPWGRAARDALVSGTSGALLSTAALAATGRVETGTAVAPINAISRWTFGERAARHNAPSLRHTAVGFLTHHSASIFWALFYERWFGRRADRGDVPGAIAGGAAISALACFVDYRLTPRRLQPGYELRLGKPSLAVVYACFGLGLAIGSLLDARYRR